MPNKETNGEPKCTKKKSALTAPEGGQPTTEPVVIEQSDAPAKPKKSRAPRKKVTPETEANQMLPDPPAFIDLSIEAPIFLEDSAPFTGDDDKFLELPESSAKVVSAQPSPTAELLRDADFTGFFLILTHILRKSGMGLKPRARLVEQAKEGLRLFSSVEFSGANYPNFADGMALVITGMVTIGSTRSAKSIADVREKIFQAINMSDRWPSKFLKSIPG